MTVGTEWLVDATGCRTESLRNIKLLRALFERIIAELRLQTVGEMVWYQFPPPAGVTGLALLSESHLACHTYPEHGLATINLYCCRTRPEWPWAERLCEILGARNVTVRRVQRCNVAIQEQAQGMKTPEVCARKPEDLAGSALAKEL
jgi:S-adenosylmethionine decarboxylase